MGHSVTGLVGTSRTLQDFASRHGLPRPVVVGHALSFLPLRDDDIDRLIPVPQDGHRAGFTYLSRQLVEVLRNASLSDQLVYFETDYHGGTGGQGAVAFCDGKIAYGPEWSGAGPINAALALLGVLALPPARDAFEAVGLARYRYTEDWLDSDG